MKRFSTALLLGLALLAFSPSDAQADCDYNCCDCLDFDVTVEYLWWKPCAGDLSYAAKLDDSNTKIESICLDRESGLRATLSSKNFLFGWELGASYTYIDSCSTASVSANIDDDESILSVNGHPGVTFFTFEEGKGTWDSTYSEWDVLLSFNNSCSDCHDLKHSFGVAGIKFNEKLEASLTESVASQKTTWKSDIWGAGLRAGSSYTRRVTDCISFYANGNGTLLVGFSDSEINFNTADDEDSISVKITESDRCRIIPGYHLGTGFEYNTCICKCDLSFRLGYEFLAWYNLPNLRTFTQGITDESLAQVGLSTSSNSKVFGFHGLHAGVKLSF